MVFDPERLVAIRRAINFSQEQMARLLGVSFASVNRWEHGSSGPTGTVAEVYRALDVALKAGRLPAQIMGSGSTDPGRILHHIFHAAYGSAR